MEIYYQEKMNKEFKLLRKVLCVQVYVCENILTKW